MLCLILKIILLLNGVLLKFILRLTITIVTLFKDTKTIFKFDGQEIKKNKNYIVVVVYKNKI